MNVRTVLEFKLRNLQYIGMIASSFFYYYSSACYSTVHVERNKQNLPNKMKNKGPL